MRKSIKLMLIILLFASLMVVTACMQDNKCGSFALTGPSDNATGTELKPTFKWNASRNASSYTLIVSENQDLSGEKAEITGITATRYKLTEHLKEQTRYYWKVTAIGEGEGNTKDCDDVFSFITATYSLGEFNLTMPLDNARNVSSDPSFEWEECADAVSYTLLVSKNEDFSGEDNIEINDITENSITVGQSLNGTTVYYWKVTAVGEGEDNNTDCQKSFSFTTADTVLQDFNKITADTFDDMFTVQPASDNQEITATLSETDWQGMKNEKSLKLNGKNITDWDYMQVKSSFPKVDLTSYDGIQFWIYPQTADERLGVILHLVNGGYPNDATVQFKIKGNAPSLVKIPFSLFTLSDESTLEKFDSSDITGIWFTFKNASLLGLGDGFSGRYSEFVIYFDDFKGYKDKSITDIDYQTSYIDEFKIVSIDTSQTVNKELTLIWTKSGAGNSYTVTIASDDKFACPVYSEIISGTPSIMDGMAVYTGTLNCTQLQPGNTYYVKIICSDTETEAKYFEIIDVMVYDFENYADLTDLTAACAEGMTDTNSLLGISGNGGYNNSTALKIKENTTGGAGAVYLKRLWDFSFDYFEFYYNVPSGSADFFLRLYLDTGSDYVKRAQINFTGDVKLSGSGFIRIPFNSEYMQAKDVTDEEIDTLNVKGLGLYVNKGSSDFYIDNITLYRSAALPASKDYIHTASLRNELNSLSNGQYTLVVQRSYLSGGQKTLFPVVSKTFNVNGNASDISAADFEDMISDSNKYIYTVYSGSTVIAMGKLEPANILPK